MLLTIDDQAKFEPSTAAGFEWLETNGLGGFASSTIIGMNTRRYHGLLTAALQPPEGRYVLLSKLEEDLIIGDQRYLLSTNQYEGTIHPAGYAYLISFELSPFPLWIYQIEHIILEKKLLMIDGQNTITVQYRINDISHNDQKKNISLELRALCAFRYYHQTTHQNDFLNPAVEESHQLFSFQPYPDLPKLYFAHDGQELEKTGVWYKNFYFAREQERGLDAREDLFNPCVLRFNLNVKPSASVIVSDQVQNIANLSKLFKKETKRREALIEMIEPVNMLKRRLTLAADQFIVRRGDQNTVIAGYHWFGDWGRDTMVALPGLTLATGRYEEAKNILLEFAKYVDQGMLPNRFVGDSSQVEYNSVDASFWYFEAIRQYAEYTHDKNTIKDHLYPVLKSIIDWHIKGTRYNIRMDEDGLINCGQEGVQLTWMDAKIGDWVVTPRSGKPVEIQALWFNALCIMNELAKEFKYTQDAEFYDTSARKAQSSFNQAFWNEAQQGLYDVIQGDFRDDAIRPNQILAIGLHYAILDKSRFKNVLDLVRKFLWTPVGLRTLNEANPNYKGIYQGDPLSRDGAYHQGTVWPWLLGPYFKAYLKAYGKTLRSKKNVSDGIVALEKTLDEYGLNQIGEIFDGQVPHAPRGCIAQAWSIGQMLELLKEIDCG